MIRILDILLSLFGLIVGAPILLVLYLLGLFDTGDPIFKQERIGQNKKIFILFKFRSMRSDTPSVASHLVNSDAVTTYGLLIRKFKLDELPQLFNVLVGDMSLVGPRPCLPSQDELIKSRDRLDIFRARPGITGLGQILGIDMADPVKLAQEDKKLISNLSLKVYFWVLFLTLFGKGFGDRVRFDL